MVVTEKEAALRLLELDGALTDLLLARGLLERLPEAYRLVIIPLDEPEVAAYALRWAQAPNPEGVPLVYALFQEGKPQALLLPGGEALVPQAA